MPSPEMWTQFLSLQTPMMQSMMSSYLEQSKNLFVQMQEQMQAQTRNMFQNFPFGPNAPGGHGTGGASPDRGEFREPKEPKEPREG